MLLADGVEDRGPGRVLEGHGDAAFDTVGEVQLGAVEGGEALQGLREGGGLELEVDRFRVLDLARSGNRAAGEDEGEDEDENEGVLLQAVHERGSPV